MMKKLILHTTILLLLASVISCSDKLNSEEYIISKDMETIVGNWKLEKILSSGFGPAGTEPQSWDYSNNNIIYMFKKDGILTVSVDSETIPDYYGNYTIGNHTYTIICDKEGYGLVGLSYGLKIDNSVSWYILSSKELIIDSRPLDVVAHYLTKID